MKTTKEYPATHSMSTAWFAVDANGEVAIIDFEDNGPVPDGIPEMCIEELVENAIDRQSDLYVNFTDEQWDDIISKAKPVEEYLYDDFTYVWNMIAEIDMDKYDIIEEAYRNNPENTFICLNEAKHLYKIHFTPEWDKSAKKSEASEKQASELNKKIFEEKAVLRYIEIYVNIVQYAYERKDSIIDKKEGVFETMPFYLFQQPYDTKSLIERTFVPDRPLNVKQLSQKFIDRALRLPIKFSQTERFQIAEFRLTDTTHSYIEDVLVYKGQLYKLLPQSNGKEAYFLFRCADEMKGKVPLIIPIDNLPEGAETKRYEEFCD